MENNKRVPGFYWVKIYDGDAWVAASYITGGYWLSPGNEDLIVDVFQINETRILNPDENNDLPEWYWSFEGKRGGIGQNMINEDKKDPDGPFI